MEKYIYSINSRIVEPPNKKRDFTTFNYQMPITNNLFKDSNIEKKVKSDMFKANPKPIFEKKEEIFFPHPLIDESSKFIFNTLNPPKIVSNLATLNKIEEEKMPEKQTPFLDMKTMERKGLDFGKINNITKKYL